MQKMNYGYWLISVVLAGLLFGCSGTGSESGSGSSPAVLTSVTGGIAVDPYIVNAQLEELAADGITLRQRSSSLTDAQGRFSFPEPIAEHSLIRFKASQRGLHGNAPYAGLLKRRVVPEDSGPVVVSPLTTLLANGMTGDQVINLLANAGLPGLSRDDLLADPMAGLDEQPGVADAALLRRLQANMAAGSFMEAIDNFNYNGLGTLAVGLELSDMVAVVRQTLSAELFEQLAPQIGSDFTAGDFIQTAARLNRTIVSQLRQELAAGAGQLPSERLGQLVANALVDCAEIAREVHQGRLGDPAPDPDPTPDPIPDPTPDPGTPATGAELYQAECQGCHGSLAGSNISNRTAVGIQAAISGNAGGMGSLVLDAAQLELIADSLPAPQPPPVEPPQYRNGQAVYDQDCAGCHKLSGHDPQGGVDLAAMGASLVSLLEAGHQGRLLPTQELNALADFADSFAAPQPPVVPRDSQTVYNDNCAGCHKLFGFDPSGSIDLAGLGSSAAAKVPAGHGGSVSTVELTSLAGWLDSWAPAPPPVVARDGETVYGDNCAGCHKLYGYDASGNLDLASLGDSAQLKLASGHGGSVSAEEAINLADWLDSWAPAPPPVVDRNGETVYTQNCAGCHKLYGYDGSGSIDLAGAGGAAETRLATGHGGSLTAGEISNLAGWLDGWAPAPPPVVARDGETVYGDNCAACHQLYGYDPSGSLDLASLGDPALVKLASGHGGSVSAEEALNLANWLDSWAPAPPPVVDRTGQAVYDDNCAGCHQLYGYDANGSLDLASQGDSAQLKLASGHGGSLTSGEISNLAGWLDGWAPAPPPVVARDGETVYGDNCAGCHKLYGYDASGSLDLASLGDPAQLKLASGHGGSVSAEEAINLADWLDSWAPAPPPVVARDGETVYGDNCAGCHKLYGYDASGSLDLASLGDSAQLKLASGHGGSVLAEEVLNLADWLDSWAPAPPPVVTRNGETVYNDNCAGCHLVNGYDASGSIDLAGQGELASGKLQNGHGGSVSADERSNLVNWLNGFAPGDPYAGACDSCHGQPPSGSSFPDSAGSHAVHTALAGLDSNCAACHANAAHNDLLDLELTATWDAKSGIAGDNGDGTCSNVSCHGGLTTPDWYSGTLSVDTQCRSCHAAGTSQYIGYASGKHDKHVRSKNLDCTVCHDPDRLRNGHFNALATRSFEQAPSATIRSSLSYSGGKCGNVSCHGDNKSW